MHDAARAELIVEGDTASFRLEIDGAATRMEYEFALALALRLARFATGLRLRPAEVQLPGPPARDDSEHRRLLADRVVWCAPRAAILFPASALDAMLSPPDAPLRDALIAYADRALARLTEVGTFTRRVREHLERELPTGVAGATTLDLAAAELGINARTLRRRLADEGTTFFEQLDDVRRQLAVEYVERSSRPLTEVAALLGFGSTSALHKAFRRWTGRGPMTYRMARRDR
jgi:AraC-like DNA-binding protein